MKVDSSNLKIKRYHWRSLYLAHSFAFIGVIPEYIVNIPLCILGFFLEPAWRCASRINVHVFRWVLASQPWWTAKIQVNLPQEVRDEKVGCLTVSNHRSYYDVFTLFSLHPYVRILSKSLMYTAPLFGHMLFLLKMIPVQRGNPKSFWRAMEKIEKGLGKKHRVHVFPEMTRCEEGSLELGRFTVAPFQMAMKADVPVVPLVFWGTDALWPKGSFKIGKHGTVVVRSLPALYPKDFNSPLELAQEAKKRIYEAQLQLSKEYPFGT